MDRANIEFNNPFKKTKDLSQLFRQAEIDAVGIDIQKNTVYAVDIAFHEGGLSYGDRFETAKRITKKIIRTILILQQYFKNTTHHEIVFVSPKINPEPLLILKSEIERISSFLAKESIPCKIKLISNDAFNNEILEPITHLSKNVADTSELFLRSIQLVHLFKPIKKEKTFAPVVKSEKPELVIRPKIKNSSGNSSEINKVKRKIPGWFRAPKQINSTILLSYMELAEHNINVTEQMIRNNCSTLSDFKGNFNQMKNFGEKIMLKYLNKNLAI